MTASTHTAQHYTTGGPPEHTMRMSDPRVLASEVTIRDASCPALVTIPGLQIHLTLARILQTL